MNPATLQGPSWFEQVGGWPASDVARRFGLEVEKRASSLHAKPCPLCGDGTRHHKSRDKRGAIGFRADGTGWRCFQCDSHGDAVGLAAACVLQKTANLLPAEWATVRRACAERGLCDPDPRDNRPAPPVRYVPPPPRAPVIIERPARDEVMSLWRAGAKLSAAGAAGDALTASYVAGRGINVGDLELFEPELCRVLPAPGAYAFPKWWPAAWANVWRWAVLAYEPNGDVGSIHARAVVDPGDGPRTRWPYKMGAAGMFFANARGVALLRGERSDAEAVLVTEGLSDTVSASVFYAADGRRFAVLGVTSGAAEQFKAIRWPMGLECLVATDADKEGDRYAVKVREALPRSVVVKRLRLGGVHG